MKLVEKGGYLFSLFGLPYEVLMNINRKSCG